jgi:hypothetical protein
MYFVFCRLYPSSSAVFRILPIISLLLINAPGAGLPIRMIEEVSWEPKRRRAWASHYLIPRLWHLRINNNIWNSNSFYFVKILTCSMWCRLAWTYHSRTLQSYPWYTTHVNLKRCHCPCMKSENFKCNRLLFQTYCGKVTSTTDEIIKNFLRHWPCATYKKSYLLSQPVKHL